MSTVALCHCDTVENIFRQMQILIGHLGTEKVVRLFRNRRVLLKPNVCIDMPPQRGATTHPAVLDAMISIGKDMGAQIIVGDGAAIGVKGKAFEKTGIAEVCKRHNIEFVDFNREEGRKIQIKGAFALDSTFIARTYFDVDTIINMQVFKSNMLYWISGALKNMKGLMVGLEKHKPHYLGVPQCVADLNRAVRQDLIIMDGYIGMMGDGPTAGKPANTRLLLAGFDPVAVDTAAAQLMGFPVKKIPMLKWAAEAEIGSQEVDLVGEPISSFNLKFEKPAIARNRLKAALIDWGGKYFFRNAHQKSKIIIDAEKCQECGRCEKMCPFKAIKIHNKVVIVDRDKCDFCLCCSEVCQYNAISMKGMLTRKDAFMR